MVNEVEGAGSPFFDTGKCIGCLSSAPEERLASSGYSSIAPADSCYSHGDFDDYRHNRNSPHVELFYSADK
jgi:hypothetical protein